MKLEENSKIRYIGETDRDYTYGGIYIIFHNYEDKYVVISSNRGYHCTWEMRIVKDNFRNMNFLPNKIKVIKKLRGK
jgi:hypothetical protein